MSGTPALADASTQEASVPGDTGPGVSASDGARIPGSWEELVTCALLGTKRRTPPGGATGRDAPGALLDAAAVRTVGRRAGLSPARAGRRPPPAPADPR